MNQSTYFPLRPTAESMRPCFGIYLTVLSHLARHFTPFLCHCPSNACEEGRLPPEPPFTPCPASPRQAGRAAAFFRRRENAARAPAPNRITIEGSGTWVPEVELDEHLWP